VIRVLIADDHRLLREIMREVLVNEGFEVVGDAGDGPSVVSVAGRTHPDVILLDVEMPGHYPTDTLRRLKGVSPRSRVIVLTMHDEPQLVRQMLHAGVSAYLHKSVSRHDLAAAIRAAVQDDDRPVTISVTRTAAAEVGDMPSGPLSAREIEVLMLVAQAMSNRQIATRLSITEGTVKRHLRNVFTKLDATSRLDAVNKGISAALIPAATDRGTRPGRVVRPLG
jgi:two-component system nitrate/nitrite response regulator NarL